MAFTKTCTALALCLLTLLNSQSSAHFLLNYPSTIGFSDDLEGQAPCGSFTVDFSKNNVTDFHVGGDSVALTSTHPMATWLFRATLDQTATKGNWTTLLPAISQTGLGSFCERSITVPSGWAGQKGVISVVQGAADGFLYQCAAVNFVAGSAQPPSSCTNGTDTKAAYTADPALSSIPATATAMPSDKGSSTSMSMSASATGSASATTGGPAPSGSSATKSEAQMLGLGNGGSGLLMGALVTTFVAVTVVLGGVL